MCFRQFLLIQHFLMTYRNFSCVSWYQRGIISVIHDEIAFNLWTRGEGATLNHYHTYHSQLGMIILHQITRDCHKLRIMSLILELKRIGSSITACRAYLLITTIIPVFVSKFFFNILLPFHLKFIHCELSNIHVIWVCIRA